MIYTVIERLISKDTAIVLDHCMQLWAFHRHLATYASNSACGCLPR